MVLPGSPLQPTWRPGPHAPNPAYHNGHPHQHAAYGNMPTCGGQFAASRPVSGGPVFPELFMAPTVRPSMVSNLCDSPQRPTLPHSHHHHHHNGRDEYESRHPAIPRNHHHGDRHHSGHILQNGMQQPTGPLPPSPPGFVSSYPRPLEASASPLQPTLPEVLGSDNAAADSGSDDEESMRAKIARRPGMERVIPSAPSAGALAGPSTELLRGSTSQRPEQFVSGRRIRIKPVTSAHLTSSLSPSMEGQGQGSNEAKTEQSSVILVPPGEVPPTTDICPPPPEQSVLLPGDLPACSNVAAPMTGESINSQPQDLPPPYVEVAPDDHVTVQWPDQGECC